MGIDGKLEVKEAKTSSQAGRDARLENVIRVAAGRPLPLREARSRLFLLLREVLAGTPRLVFIEDIEVVCLVTLPDLVDIVGEKGPTVGEMLDSMAARRRVRKTDTTGRAE